MKKYSTLLRLIFSLALLAYLVATVDFAPMKELWPRLDLRFYAVGVLIMAVYVVVQGWVLATMLGGAGIRVGVGRMAHMCATSAFFGVFLPGGAGGDVVMSYHLCKSQEDKAGAISAILFARIASLAMMVLVALVASFSPLNPIPATKPFFAIVVAAMLAGYWVFTRGESSRLAERILGFMRRHKVTALVLDTMLSLSRVSGNKPVVIRALPLIVAVSLMRVWMDYFMARALGLEVPMVAFMIFVPLVNIITLIPISIAGLGIRESSYVQLLDTLGVPAAAAFSMSILSFTLTLWVCLVGAVLYMTRGEGRG